MDLTIAVDPGKRSDPTALALVERQRPYPPEDDVSKWPGPWRVPGRETIYLVRELGRLRIGVKHTDGAYEIASVCHDTRCFDPDGSLQVMLDCTGIGEGIADMIEGYLPSGVRLQRCWFTGSERVTRVDGELRIGKSFMISRLTSLLETGRVRLGDVPQRQALVEELRDFEFKVSGAGSYSAEARSSSHDDLLTCLGLGTLLRTTIGKTSTLRPRPSGSGPWLGTGSLLTLLGQALGLRTIVIVQIWDLNVSLHLGSVFLMADFEISPLAPSRLGKAIRADLEEGSTPICSATGGFR